jgi:hypothetical protein
LSVSGKHTAQQAAWQKTRRALSWPEKIRQAERMRQSIDALRSARGARPPDQQRAAERASGG